MARTAQSAATRYLMFSLSFALAMYFAYKGEWDKTGLFLLTMALLLWAYLRHGSVWLAFWHFQRGNFERTDAILKTLSPERLDVVNQSYYYWLKGLMEARMNALMAAKNFFDQVRPERLINETHRKNFRSHVTQLQTRLSPHTS
ncbi:MAG TPA: hypothetical protein PLL64_11940 [Rhodothermales bacterium]|nr:hypothetical protein [Bacteroidota bacterium]HRK74979.1 hypothetical protein [Rhodothermales bacterium]HRR10298.1 hypothetical protein [Rhodothermales bacterium]